MGDFYKMKIGKTLQDIKRKSKEQSKRKNYMGWFQSFGGEAPINNAFFNMAMGTADSSVAGTSADGSVGAVSSMGEKLQKRNKDFIGDNKMTEGKDTVTLYLDESHSEDGKIVVDKDDVVKALVSLLYYSPEYIDKDDEEIESDVLSNFDKDVDLYYNDLVDIFYKPLEDCAYDCDSDPYFLQYTFDGIDSDDPKIEVTEYESPSEYKFDEDWNDTDFDDEDADDRFELIDRKTVYDSNGFTTEYSMYYDSLEDKYVMVFGDSDLYRPEDEYYDAEFDDEKTAREWFDNYRGFEDEDDYNFDVDECIHKERILPSYVKEKPIVNESYSDKITLCDSLASDAVELCHNFFKFNPATRKFKISPDEREELILDFLGDAREESHQAGFSDEEENVLIKELSNYFNVHKPKVGQPAVFYGSLFKLDRTKEFIKNNHKSGLDKKESFKYDDTPLNETAMSDLAFDVEFEQDYVDKLKRNISYLEKELDFLKNTAPKEIRRGGAFDSQEEIDDAIKATEREKDRLVAKYKIIMRGKNK